MEARRVAGVCVDPERGARDHTNSKLSSPQVTLPSRRPLLSFDPVTVYMEDRITAIHSYRPKYDRESADMSIETV